MEFVHLKSYSEFSITQGLNTIDQLVDIAKNNKMPSLALTDLNGLFGAIKFFESARNSGIKAIIGCDVTIEQENGNTYQLTLLAKNNTGYKNLMNLLGRGYTENREPGKVAIKEDWLIELNNIIILSGAKNGLIGQKIISNEYNEAKLIAEQMKEVFGNNFYIELQRDGSIEENDYIQGAVNICSELNIAPVATHPVLFKEKDDFIAHEAKHCITTQKYLFDINRQQQFNKEMYFKSKEEMIELFSDLPEAIENTNEIAKKCNLEIVLGKNQLPHYEIKTGQTEEEYFVSVAKEGLERRLKAKFKNIEEIEKNRKQYDERLDYELNIIKDMKFPGYFLVVADFINWAKKNDIPIGPGRGSGAGSLVAYSMGITDLDPLPYGLLFERFLNPERVSMPDLDIDMCQSRRDEIIEYVKNKYGANAVAQVCTFGTMATKGVVRDAGRVLGINYNKVNDFSKLITLVPSKKLSLQDYIFGNEKEGIEPNEKMISLYNSDSQIKKLVDIAPKLEGLTRNIGTNASAVLIAPTKITDFSPLFTVSKDTNVISQYDKDDIEKTGLIKFDFLGLANLTIIKNTLNTIKQEFNEDVDIDNIPLDDEKIYKNIFANGNTTTVFQFESNGMKKVLKQSQPTKFEDLAALNGLYRPGPMDVIPLYIESKFKKEEDREYPHSMLKNVLQETYGYMIYQEQVMECAKIIAGYSLGGADLLRRAMGKKKPEEMAKQREIFIKGAAKNNVPEKDASELFDLIEKFSGYGFNKSHAAAYALIAYQTAYLKHYYPEAFLASNLNNTDKTDKIAILLEDCKNNNVKILPVDINKSFAEFKIEGQKTLRYGMLAIKGAGDDAVKSIVTERENNGPYKDFYDFLERVGKGHVNKRVIEGLIQSGAFDSLNANRNQLLSGMKEVMDYFTKVRKQKNENVSILGDALDPTNTTPIKPLKAKRVKKQVELIRPELPNIEPWNEIIKSQKEKESLGLYLTTNPYKYYSDQLNTFKVSERLATLFDLHDEGKHEVFISGIVEDIVWWKSKKGAFVKISDGTSTVSVRMFADTLDNNSWLNIGEFVSAKVKLDVQDAYVAENSTNENDDNKVSERELSLTNINIFNFEQTKQLITEKVFVACEKTTENIEKFKEICNKFKPDKNIIDVDIPVVLCVAEENSERRNKREMFLSINNVKAIEEFKEYFGSNWVKSFFKEDVDKVRFPEVNKNRNYKSNKPYFSN